QGHAVPPDYGALLHVTRMGRNGIGGYERDELMEAMDYGVIFNMAESELMIDEEELDAPYGSATVFRVDQQYALEKGIPGPEYSILVRFVRKGRRAFRWSTKAPWSECSGKRKAKAEEKKRIERLEEKKDEKGKRKRRKEKK